MERYVKSTVILMLVLSLLSGCTVFGSKNKTFNAYELRVHTDGEMQFLKNQYTDERFKVVDEEYLIPYIFTVKNDYLYYGVWNLDKWGIFSGYTIWRQEMFGDYNKKIIAEFEKDCKPCQIGVDDDDNVYIFTKDKKDVWTARYWNEDDWYDYKWLIFYRDANQIEPRQMEQLNSCFATYYLYKYDKNSEMLWCKDISDDLRYDAGETFFLGYDRRVHINQQYRWNADNYESVNFNRKVGFLHEPDYMYSGYDIKVVYFDSKGLLYAASESGVATFDTEDGNLKYWFKYGEDYKNNYIIASAIPRNVTINGGESEGINITGIIEDRQGKKYAVFDRVSNYENYCSVRAFGLDKKIDSEKIMQFKMDNIGIAEKHHFSNRFVFVDENTFTSGLNYDFLVRDLEYLYGCDLQNGKIDAALAFANVGIFGQNVLFTAELSDGRIVVLEGMNDSCILRDVDAVILTPSTDDQIKRLKLGTSNTDCNLCRKVAEFNRNNTDCKIVLGEYGSYSDLYSESDFDMFSVMGDSYKCENLVKNGIIEDMGPYIDASERVSREDFYSNIIDAHTYNGVLVGIPTHVTETIVAGITTVEEENITIERIEEIFKENPKWRDIAVKADVLYALLSNNIDKLWDENTYQIDDKNELYYEYENYAKEFTGGIGHDIRYVDNLLEAGIDDYVVGVRDNSLTYCISSASSYKDEAWSFIESILADEWDYYSGVGITDGYSEPMGYHASKKSCDAAINGRSEEKEEEYAERYEDDKYVGYNELVSRFLY